MLFARLKKGISALTIPSLERQSLDISQFAEPDPQFNYMAQIRYEPTSSAN